VLVPCGRPGCRGGDDHNQANAQATARLGGYAAANVHGSGGGRSGEGRASPPGRARGRVEAALASQSRGPGAERNEDELDELDDRRSIAVRWTRLPRWTVR
jgi:hypothetical protein